MSDLKYLAFDLELEQPNKSGGPDDSQVTESRIIQVGWVVFSPVNDFTVYKRDRMHVNIGCPLSTYIKKLTHISDDDIADGTTIADIVRRMHQDHHTYGFKRIPVEWGAGDMAALRSALSSDEEWVFGRSAFDAKKLYQFFAAANGWNPSGGLSKCLTRLGLPWLGGRKHDAEHDALNTAYLFTHLFNEAVGTLSKG